MELLFDSMEIDGRENDLSYKWILSSFTDVIDKNRVKNVKKTRLPNHLQPIFIFFFYNNLFIISS